MIRKVSDELRALAGDIAQQQGVTDPKELARAIDDAIRMVSQKQKSRPVTASEIEVMAGSGLAKAIAVAILMALPSLAKAGESTDISTDLAKAADSLATIRVEQTGTLPGTKVSTIAGLKVTINTNAQDESFKVINSLDKSLAGKGMKQEDRQKVLEPMLKSMGMVK